VEQSPHMEIVQIVLDKKLLDAADKAARRSKLNRSELVREALRQHLRRLDLQAREELDRKGYARQPQARGESHHWETEAAWPAE
jgi:metal-responsive CopG/Arc/MetJ family transcriptional regulator